MLLRLQLYDASSTSQPPATPTSMARGRRRCSERSAGRGALAVAQGLIDTVQGPGGHGVRLARNTNGRGQHQAVSTR